ncbi:hypothetical protein DL93DRAFT_2174488 [Clavulina sp. PMI_390]|nr:hypothetical protein DL93DRAFT_2174488 [Clavulina sp. PMI_390]
MLTTVQSPSGIDGREEEINSSSLEPDLVLTSKSPHDEIIGETSYHKFSHLPPSAIFFPTQELGHSMEAMS